MRQTFPTPFVALLSVWAGLALATSARADLADSSEKIACAQQARAVAAAMRSDAQASLSSDEFKLAYRAAYASCLQNVQTVLDDTDEARVARVDGVDPNGRSATTNGSESDDRSAMERFWAGLFSIENKTVKKRAGKYRHVVNER